MKYSDTTKEAFKKMAKEMVGSSSAIPYYYRKKYAKRIRW